MSSEIRPYAHSFIVTNVCGGVAAFIFRVQALCKLKSYLKALDESLRIFPWLQIFN